MKPPLLRTCTLTLLCWLALSSAVRAEQVTLSLGMSFDKVIEAIQKFGGQEDNRSDVKPPGYTWSVPVPFNVILDLGEDHGKLSYLMYYGLHEVLSPFYTYDPYAFHPLQSLTFDTETHKVLGEWLPPGTRVPIQSMNWQVRVEMLVVALPQEKALALLPDLSDESKVDAAYKEVMAAIQRKEARLIGYPVIIMSSGQKAIAETSFEKLYPTQYEPPQSPDERTAKSLGASLPSSFEKRNVGVTMEVEPVVKEGGKWINLNLQTQHVQYDGMDTYEFQKGPGVVGKMEQPRFFTNKDSFSMTVRHGQRVLMGVHKNLRNDEVEFHLIQVLTMPVL